MVLRRLSSCGGQNSHTHSLTKPQNATPNLLIKSLAASIIRQTTFILNGLVTVIAPAICKTPLIEGLPHVFTHTNHAIAPVGIRALKPLRTYQ